MSFWAELVDAAVLGSGRSTPPTPAPAIEGLGQSTDDHSAGGQNWREGTVLLHWAAVASRTRRAGYGPSPGADRTAPEPAPADPRPPVSTAARERLAGLLDTDQPAQSEQSELTCEWLRLLARTGRRPPDGLLPLLLDNAANVRVRQALEPVLGPLAEWLAAANPDWAWVTAARSVEYAGEQSPRESWSRIWATGSHRTRRELLSRVRLTDPAAGRDLVAQTWASDSARDRAAFTGCLAMGLSAADEPLLDRALTDRASEVRRAASILLGRLPGSAFADRAARRAADAVRVTTVRAGLRSGRRLEILPPTQATEEMVADGLDPAPPRGIGRQTWLLQQIVAGPPARWWRDHTGLEPGILLDLASSTGWTAPLETGWSDAATRDAHLPWIAAFLELPPGRRERMGDAATISLLRALTDADRDAWFAGHPESPLFSAADLVPGPWSAELSAAARMRIAALATADPGHSPQARRLFQVAAMRLEPPVAPDVDPEHVHPRLADRWAELTTTLSVRAAMRRELTEELVP